MGTSAFFDRVRPVICNLRQLEVIGALTMTNATKVATPVVKTDRNAWKFGFTPQSELWNGRFAMIGFVAALAIELYSGQGVLHFWGLL